MKLIDRFVASYRFRRKLGERQTRRRARLREKRESVDPLEALTRGSATISLDDLKGLMWAQPDENDENG
jgi:hypothetical protein